MTIIAETIVEVMSKTGISLDPEFCAKAVRGMLCEMERNPDRFAGKRVLFIHSGIIIRVHAGSDRWFIFSGRWSVWSL